VLHKDHARKEVETQVESLENSDSKEVAYIYELIQTESGLLSENPVCSDSKRIIRMAREMVSSHLPEGPREAQGGDSFDEGMYASLVQNESERVAKISWHIYGACGLSNENVDWELLVYNARKVISPYAEIESDADANRVIGGTHIGTTEE
jgi:hypothetical protein